MKKFKIALCAVVIASSLSIGTYADGPGPGTCRDGDVPLNGRCKDGYPPLPFAGNPVNDKTTLEDFYNWVLSLL